MASIRSWLVIATVISGSGLIVVSAEDFGLMKLWVPENELNRVATHILDNHLLPHVRQYKFEDYVLMFGQTTRFSVTDIRIESLESVVTCVQLLPGNEVVITARLPLLSVAANFTLELQFMIIRIESLESVVTCVQLLPGNEVVITARLPLLSIAANFTLELQFMFIRIESLESVVTSVHLLPGNEVVLTARLPLLSIAANFTLELLQGNEKPDRYPDAIITAEHPSLNLTVEIGTGDLGSSISLKECHADFSTLTSTNDDLRRHLLALIELGAKSTLAELVEEVCPFLEEEAQTALIDILDIEETFRIKDAASQNIDIDVRVEYTETSSESASVVTSVVEHGSPAPTFQRSDERFPAYGRPGERFELWLDAPLMELLSESAITEKVFSDTSYSTSLGGQSYDVYAKLSTVEYGIEVTNDGIILKTHANMTLDHIGQGLNPCIVVHVDLDANTPAVITNNDRLIVISPDLDRLKINFTVTNLDGKCDIPTTAQQEQLVDAYSRHFQDSLKEKYIDIDVIKTDYFLFKDIKVTPDEGFIRIIFLLNLDVTSTPSERNVIEYHRTAGGKLINLKPLGAPARVLEFKPLAGDPNRASGYRQSVLTAVIVVIVAAFV